MKYVRVMDGLKSNANGFEYKLDEINMNIDDVISLITNQYTITDDLLQGIIDVAGPNHYYVFVTGYAGPLQPRESHNAIVTNFASHRGNVYIADWWELSHNNWSLMYADHIHLNPEGRRAYANLINNVIRSSHR